MATQVKRARFSNFKTSVKSTYNNVKQKAKNTYDKTKKKVGEYAGVMHSAYDVGYFSGVNDYAKLPKTVGSHTSATAGYNKGLKDTHKAQKYNEKLKNKKAR